MYRKSQVHWFHFSSTLLWNRGGQRSLQTLIERERTREANVGSTIQSKFQVTHLLSFDSKIAYRRSDSAKIILLQKASWFFATSPAPKTKGHNFLKLKTSENSTKILPSSQTFARLRTAPEGAAKVPSVALASGKCSSNVARAWYHRPPLTKTTRNGPKQDPGIPVPRTNWVGNLMPLNHYSINQELQRILSNQPNSGRDTWDIETLSRTWYTGTASLPVQIPPGLRELVSLICTFLIIVWSAPLGKTKCHKIRRLLCC